MLILVALSVAAYATSLLGQILAACDLLQQVFYAPDVSNILNSGLSLHPSLTV